MIEKQRGALYGTPDGGAPITKDDLARLILMEKDDDISCWDLLSHHTTFRVDRGPAGGPGQLLEGGVQRHIRQEFLEGRWHAELSLRDSFSKGDGIYTKAVSKWHTYQQDALMECCLRMVTDLLVKCGPHGDVTLLPQNFYDGWYSVSEIRHRAQAVYCVNTWEEIYYLRYYRKELNASSCTDPMPPDDVPPGIARTARAHVYNERTLGTPPPWVRLDAPTLAATDAVAVVATPAWASPPTHPPPAPVAAASLPPAPWSPPPTHPPPTKAAPTTPPPLAPVAAASLPPALVPTAPVGPPGLALPTDPPMAGHAPTQGSAPTPPPLSPPLAMPIPDSGIGIACSEQALWTAPALAPKRTAAAAAEPRSVLRIAQEIEKKIADARERQEVSSTARRSTCMQEIRAAAQDVQDADLSVPEPTPADPQEELDLVKAQLRVALLALRHAGASGSQRMPADASSV